MTSFDELGQDAQLAVHALDRYGVLTGEQLVSAIRIQQFDEEAAKRGLGELERKSLSVRHGQTWELTAIGRQLAASVRDDDNPFVT